MTNAKMVHDYFIRYKQYLLDNNLDDDSKTITVKQLIRFVDNHIDEEE